MGPSAAQSAALTSAKPRGIYVESRTESQYDVGAQHETWKNWMKSKQVNENSSMTCENWEGRGGGGGGGGGGAGW